MSFFFLIIAFLFPFYLCARATPPIIFLGLGKYHRGGFLQLHSSEYGAQTKHESKDYFRRIGQYWLDSHTELELHKQLDFWRWVFNVQEDEKTKERRYWVNWVIAKCEPIIENQKQWVEEKRRL